MGVLGCYEKIDFWMNMDYIVDGLTEEWVRFVSFSPRVFAAIIIYWLAIILGGISQKSY
jgi:hypothetical protein